MLFILFNCTIFIRGHLDAQIFVGRGLVAVNLWYLSELGELSFLYLLFCAFLSMSSTCVLKYAMPYFEWYSPCIFVIYVVTSTSMQSSSRDVADFRDLEFFKSLP